MSRALVKFHSAIKSDQTRKVYDRCLNYFLRFSKIKDVEGLLQLRESALQEMVEDYVIWVKDKGLRTNTINGRVVALELFFAMNDKILNFKKIKKMYPARLKLLSGRAWTTGEVKKFLELTASIRNKAIIHVLASTGCRVGALVGLKLKNLSEMPDGCKSILFYENSSEEYYGFLTPEASRAVDSMIDLRRKAGEYIMANSPLFRTTFRIGMAKARGMSVGAFQMCLREIVRKVRGVGDGRRTEVAIMGGFRKRFNLILKSNNEINSNIAERLMGHFSKTIPLDTFYLSNLSKDILFAEFKKAIPELTISDEMRKEVVILNQQKTISELEKKQVEIDKMKEQIRFLYELLNPETK